MEHEGSEWKLPISSINLFDQPLAAPSDLFLESIDNYVIMYGLPHGEVLTSLNNDDETMRLISKTKTVDFRGSEMQPQIVSPRSAPWRGDLLNILVEQEKVLDLEIPLLRLHVPRFAGCAASYRTTSGTQDNWKMKFTILGIGNSVLANLEQAQMTEVNASQCMEVVQPGRVKLQVGPLFLNDRPVAVKGIRALIEELMPEMIFRPLEAGEDACQCPVETMPALHMSSLMHLLQKYDLRQLPIGSPSQSMSFKLATNHTLSTDVSPKLGSLADYLSLGFTIAHLSEESLEISYELAPGAAYYPYQPGGVLSTELCWTTVPA